ncbi:M20 family peptidase [Psychrobacillus glaciei]|uniref:M20 family peptidase n=1 Tax=Psychrobacillus glaciei TaxID=2283160 RepID=A0A5J6SPP5_9BACI|nr:M20 family metallopeptidase [Psychrobacillus glaciei]QFF98117.1 M20 family peptidase [Psychrobacillus glaciei]
MTRMLDYLRENQKSIEKTLIRLVKAESPSQDKKLVDLCGEVLMEEFTKLIDGDIQILKKSIVGNQYLLTYGPKDWKDQILIIGHLDTVWDKDALPLKIEGDTLYGPGVFDMKAGLTISLWAMKALKAFNIFGEKKVVLLVTSDEEIGSIHSKEIIIQEARKSSLVLIPESSIEPNGAVKTERKGAGNFYLEVKGVAAHAGINAWDGASAIEELAYQIIDLKKLANREEGISINVGIISGGSRSNVIAKDAYAEIDVRITKREQAELITQQIMNRPVFVEGTSTVVTGEIERFPLERNEKVVSLYHDLKEIALLHGYELEEGSSGGASDGNFTAGEGIPTIDGLGPIGGGAHSDNEHIILSNLPERSALLAEMIAKHLQ